MTDTSKQDAYTHGWQDALESIMSTIEDSIREIVTNFALPEEYEPSKPTGKLIVPEDKKIIIP
jgi:hypothetical protein